MQLEPGWTLERRVYQGRKLNHLYFAHQAPVYRLLALASSRGQRSGLSAVGSADAADHNTAVAHCTNHTPTNHTPGQQCPDPAAGDSLSPLRTNRHSAS